MPKKEESIEEYIFIPNGIDQSYVKNFEDEPHLVMGGKKHKIFKVQSINVEYPISGPDDSHGKAMLAVTESYIDTVKAMVKENGDGTAIVHIKHPCAETIVSRFDGKGAPTHMSVKATGELCLAQESDCEKCLMPRSISIV